MSDTARHAIRDVDNAVYVSAAAVWEMGIKESFGRLEIPSNLSATLRSDNIGILNTNIHHALSVADLPMLHQDPFDRMQIVQANLEGLTILTRDAKIQQYDVHWLGA